MVVVLSRLQWLFVEVLFQLVVRRSGSLSQDLLHSALVGSARIRCWQVLRIGLFPQFSEDRFLVLGFFS